MLGVQLEEDLRRSRRRAQLASGSEAASTIVTAAPRSRALAAISMPIQPPPMITTRASGIKAVLMRWESSTLRKVNTFDGVGAGEREPARSRPGRQHQRVVADVAAVVERHLSGRRGRCR